MKILQGVSVVALLGILAACAAPPQGPGTEWETLNPEVLQLMGAGQYDRAADAAIKALNVAETTRGPDHPDVAVSLNNLAMVYQAQGKYDLAEPLYRRSGGIMAKNFGMNHPAVATTLTNLAALYRATERAPAADALEERAARIRYVNQ